MTERPLASVSLDADDLWAYLRTHGDPGWERRPSYLPMFIPRALDVLDALGVRITFFLVGFDAARPENRPAFAEIAARGHEIGNHSFGHEVWLHLYSRSQLEEELERAEEAIQAATGEHPVGFRGPGYSWSPTLLDLLERRGYRYDATTLPTFLGPLARLYFLAMSDLDPAERERRRALFGGLRDGLRPVKPYRWRLGAERTLLEIPVTTIPVVKLPFHLSYLLYLSRVSTSLMVAYLRLAIAACRSARVEPSFLLHPLDLLGGEQVPELAFFPGMDIPGARKRELFELVLRTLGESFELVPMGVHAARLLERGGLIARAPTDGATERASARRPPAA
jgi:peptidoglycan/xylan/chitin deacetylase (PgdA/CDA1 family)